MSTRFGQKLIEPQSGSTKHRSDYQNKYIPALKWNDQEFRRFKHATNSGIKRFQQFMISGQ